MKKYFLHIAFLCFAFTLGQIKQGDIILHAGRGLEYFREVSFNYKFKLNNQVVLDTTVKDDAGNFHWVFGADYAIMKWFSCGLRLKTNQYVTEKDKKTGLTPSANSLDISIPLNFRPVNTKIFYLLLAPEFGFTSLEYKTNNPNDNLVLTGKGGYFIFNIQPSFIFKNFGFYLSLFRSGVNYKNMESNNQNFNNFIITNWSGSGVGLQLGIHRRLSTKKQNENKKEG
ncbi:MAG: hypothetical protein N3F09_04455 [Bacteroidia bacterium]|nr:hypothetical protein [Bacteroidia bacterium]